MTSAPQTRTEGRRAATLTVVRERVSFELGDQVKRYAAACVYKAAEPSSAAARKRVSRARQLEEPVDALSAAQASRQLALSLAVPEGVSVETFPVASAGRGRMCGATLTGRQRACSDDLRRTGSDRLTDLRRHNDRPRVTLELLDALARVEVANDASRNPGSGALVLVGERPIPRCAHGEPEWAQLHGRAYVTRIIETGVQPGRRAARGQPRDC